MPSTLLFLLHKQTPGPGGDCDGDNAGFGGEQVRDQHNFGWSLPLSLAVKIRPASREDSATVEYKLPEMRAPT